MVHRGSHSSDSRRRRRAAKVENVSEQGTSLGIARRIASAGPFTEQEVPRPAAQGEMFELGAPAASEPIAVVFVAQFASGRSADVMPNDAAERDGIDATGSTDAEA